MNLIENLPDHNYLSTFEKDDYWKEDNTPVV